MMYDTIDDLRSQLGAKMTPPQSAAYAQKMHHLLPPAETVDRVKFILDHCTGKRVVEFGASGPLTVAIKAVARDYWGVDRVDGDRITGGDLDDVTHEGLPAIAVTPDIIVCGEVLEHLGNPLWFLIRLRRQYAGVPVIITVPNAFAVAGRALLAKGVECVNGDHVAWYSPKTIQVLLTRAGYAYAGLYYYNGIGPTAEGLVVVTE